MANFNDRELAVAKVYARAMLDLAQQSESSAEVLEELDAILAQAEASEELSDFLSNPVLDIGARRESLEVIFRGRVSDMTLDSIQVINRKGRLQLLPVIAEAYRAELRERQGLVEVHVTSAVPLPEAQRQRLLAAIDRQTGKKSQIVETVDPDILGGLVVRVGDDKIDTSVARELDKLSAALAERASKEILAGKAYTV